MERPRSHFESRRLVGVVAVVGGLALSALLAEASMAAEAEVIAEESAVRTAPFEVAPELVRVHVGGRLSVDDGAEGGWRRVRLPDGRHGYLPDADVKVTASSQVANASNSPRKSPAEVILASPQSASTAQASAGRTLFGVMFEMLPAGTLRATAADASQTSNASSDGLVAFSVAPFLDLPLSPYAALGGSPQVIFHVKGDGSAGESATELDLRVRFTGRWPLAPSVRVIGRLSPAYSVVFLPRQPPSSSSISNPTGPQVDFAVGAEVALLPRLFFVTDLGYQLGFQSAAAPDGSSFDGTRYLHLGGGLAVGL